MPPAQEPVESGNRHEGQWLRRSFHDELGQLRLQVELMGVKVDQNLGRMRTVVAEGDETAARDAITADDEIDAMAVSLTERCYDLLARENPVASDLRFIVSVLRILSELERIGDLALRVVKLNPERNRWASNAATFDILVSMADLAADAYGEALRAWSAQDLALDLGPGLAGLVRMMDLYDGRLMAELLALEGPGAVRIATASLIAGRSLGRIADHSAIIGARLRYLITGDPDHLTEEVR